MRPAWRSRIRGAPRYLGADLAAATRRFAGALEAVGIGRERRLVMLMLDTIDFPIVFWGALRVGVIPVPVNTLLTPDLVRYVLEDSRAEAVAISAPLLPGFLDVLREAGSLRKIIVASPDGSPLRPPIDAPGWVIDDPRRGRRASRLGGDAATPTVAQNAPDEVATAGFTRLVPPARSKRSGTCIPACDRRRKPTPPEVLKITASDVMFSVAKAFHAYGLGNSMTFPMAVGASAVLLPDRPTPDAVLDTMRRHQPTMFGGVPTLYAAMLAQSADPVPKRGSPRPRQCISAGEALPEDIGNRWRRNMVGVDILDGIGSTEMLHIFISNQADDIRYGTSGKPVPGYAAMVVDEHDRPVPHGETGELVVKGAKRRRWILEPAR